MPRYSLVVPKECQAPLAEQPDDLYEDLIERAKVLDSLVRRVEVMVDLRGIVPKAELTALLDRLVDQDDLGFCNLGLEIRARGLNLVFREVRVRGIRDGAYVHNDLLVPLAIQQGSFVLAGTGLSAELMRRQGMFPRRNGDEFADVRALDSWMRTHESYRELVTYLDGRVPEGADDLAWAVNYADAVAYAARAVWDTTGALDLMAAEGLDLTEAQRHHVSDLIGALLNDVPRWTNGGWSPNELRDMGPRAGMAGRDPDLAPRRQRKKRPHKKRRR